MGLIKRIEIDAPRWGKDLFGFGSELDVSGRRSKNQKVWSFRALLVFAVIYF
jgi:hypothetical protein